MKRSRWGTVYAVWWPQHRILKIGITTNERRRWRALCLNTGGKVIYAQRGLPYMAEKAALRALRTRYRQAFASEQEARVLLAGGRGFTETFIIPSGDYHPPMLMAIEELEKYGLREAEAATDRAMDRREHDAARPGREVDGDRPTGVRGRPGQADPNRLDAAPCTVPARRAVPGGVRLALARARDRRRDRAVRGGRDRVLRDGQHASDSARAAVAVPATARGRQDPIKTPSRRRLGLGERGREGERGRGWERERRIKKRSIALLPESPAHPRNGRGLPSMRASPPGSAGVLATAQGCALSAYPSVEVRAG